METIFWLTAFVHYSVQFYLMLNVGVSSEGLYRLAGFHDDVEAIKMSFDKG